jgi:hypothetical protein
MDSIIESLRTLSLHSKTNTQKLHTDDIKNLCMGIEQLVISRPDNDINELCSGLQKLSISDPNNEIFKLLLNAVKVLQTKKRCVDRIDMSIPIYIE